MRLRPVAEADLPRFVEWLADPEVTRWLGMDGDAPTLDEEYEWWEEKIGDPQTVVWAIETRKGRLIGNIELRVKPQAQRAELGVAIQDKRERGKGFGTEAVRLVLAYAFAEMGLNRVELTCDEDNVRALRCYEKCGFVREGLLRQHRLVGRRFGNTVVMSVLRQEWQRSPAGNRRIEGRG